MMEGTLLTGLNNYGTGEGNSEIIGKQGGDMPRQARLDAPGTLHHIMIRGIEKRRIVDDDQDREQFVNRMGQVALETETKILAWSLRHCYQIWRSDFNPFK